MPQPGRLAYLFSRPALNVLGALEKQRSDVRRLLKKQIDTSSIPDDLMTAIENVALALAASGFQVGSREGKDAQRGRWMLEHGAWHREWDDRFDYIAVPVAKGTDLSGYALREIAVDAAMKERP